MKPYPKYKESNIEWLGEIPEHWTINSCGRSYEIRLGKMLSPNPNAKDDKEVPYLRAVNVQWERIDSDELPTMWASKDEIEKFSVKNGDLLVCEGGEVGRAGILKNLKHPAIIQNALHRVRSSNDNSILYLMYLLEEVTAKGWFEILCSKATIAHFTGEKFSSLRIPFPSIPEQQSIASYLDRKTTLIDKLVSTKEKQIELLKEHRTAIINHYVTGKHLLEGKDVEGKRKSACGGKDSGIEWLGEIPEHWNVVRTRFLCSITTGDKNTEDNEMDGEYPFFVRSQTVERISTYSYDGEAVLTAGDGVGVCKVFHYVNGRFDFHQRVYKLSNFKNITGRFFYYYISSNFEKEVLKLSAKSTVDSLRMPMLQDFPVAFGGKQEQLQIAQYLDTRIANIDKSISDAKKQIGLLKEYRTALISEAVTGKIDVRETR